MKKTIVGIVAAAALAVPLGFAGSAAGAPAPSSVTIVNTDTSFAYGGTESAVLTTTTRFNDNFTFVDTKLVVTVNPGNGYEGWSDTYTFTQKTPVVSGVNKKPESSGTVTSVTPYGSGSVSFVAPAGSASPFTWDGTDVVVRQPSAGASAVRAAQDAVVSTYPGTNFLFWLMPN